MQYYFAIQGDPKVDALSQKKMTGFYEKLLLPLDLSNSKKVCQVWWSGTYHFVQKQQFGTGT